MEIDLNLPQYVCMAVYQACRLNKAKVSKAKLLEACRLKPAQWSKLEADWNKFVDEKFAAAAVKRKRGRPAKTAVVTEEMEVDQPQKEETPPDPQPESYEEWKSRILEAAYEELKEMEQKKKEMKKHKAEKMEEDRRSPRKHSQSRTPRKNTQMSPRIGVESPRKVLFSPKKEAQVIQGLSSRKLSVGLKENHLLPRKDISPMQESPRRSPRKTPQKVSPYKTPTSKQGQGIRLLFPKNL